MITIAVCDDDEVTGMEVKGLIGEWDPRVKVDCYCSGEDLLGNYQPYHAIFLDIDMGGWMGLRPGSGYGRWTGRRRLYI